MTTLKNVLRINAITSGATGIALAAMPDFFANLFEVAQTGPFVEVGIFLSVFAVAVSWVSLKDPINLTAVFAIAVVDGLWVAASVMVVLFQPISISFLGNIMIAAVALWVFLMALLQFKGARSLRTT